MKKSDVKTEVKAEVKPVEHVKSAIGSAQQIVCTIDGMLDGQKDMPAALRSDLERLKGRYLKAVSREDAQSKKVELREKIRALRLEVKALEGTGKRKSDKPASSTGAV